MAIPMQSLLLGLLVLPLSVLAADVTYSVEQSTQVANTAVKTTSIAEDWDLTAGEWSAYQQLMQGPNGKWYPQLTPPAILGLNAKTEEEQSHFAAIVAKQEHDKVVRELTFNNAVHQALKRLYPEEPMIKPFNMTPFNPMAK